jgi:phage tail-like protein
MTTPNETRAYAAAHFGLELDGSQSIGVFRSIEGGGVKTEVMTYQHGGGHERWRCLGKPKYEDIKVQVGMAMSKPFYDWIKFFFRGQPKRKTGAILAADFYYKERARREFKEAMINSLTFPKLEGQDKNAAYMTVGIAVEDIVFKKGSGAALPQPKMNPQKLWTACNFKFELAGFENAVRRCAKIDSFTVKQEVAEYHAGGQLAPIKTPTPIEFPNITFYVPEVDAQPLFDHFTNKNKIHVKNNKADSPSALHGSITTLDNQGRELFRLQYTGADILSVTPDKSDSQTEEIKLVKVELYTEKMEFEYTGLDG